MGVGRGVDAGGVLAAACGVRVVGHLAYGHTVPAMRMGQHGASTSARTVKRCMMGHPPPPYGPATLRAAPYNRSSSAAVSSDGVRTSTRAAAHRWRAAASHAWMGAFRW